ncbi:putative gypsy retrotransposon integrase-like protein 1-like, partial [Triplophysa rosa]
MSIDIDNWVLECNECQKVGKPLVAPQALECIKVSAVWELIGIDLTGPLPKTVNDFQYILTITDYFSKWVEAFPLKTKSAAEVGRHICSIIYRHGCPKRILSDQGREFVNQLNNSLCNMLSIERSVTAAYHPQTNGLDEKTNDNIKRQVFFQSFSRALEYSLVFLHWLIKWALTKLVNEKQNNWDVFLDATLFSLRTKFHTTTKHSPFLLMYGREAVFPSEVPVDMPLSEIILPEEKMYITFLDGKKKSMETTKKATAENISKSQEKQKQAYAKRIQKKYQNTVYHVGDEVLLFNMRKKGRKGGRIEPDFTGPYAIQSICGKLVTLSDSKGITLKNKYNVNHIKPYRRSKTDDAQVPRQESHVPKENMTSTFSCSPPSLTIEERMTEDISMPQRPSVINFASKTKNQSHDDTNEKPVHQLSAVVAGSLFSGRFQGLRKMKFPVEEEWMCPVNFGGHWILVIVNMSIKVLVLIDPMANEVHYERRLLRNWRNFLKMTGHRGKAEKWTVHTMQHNKQHDSSSCGVLVFRLAKDYLESGDISTVQTSAQVVNLARLEIACALLQHKGNADDYCVVCSLLEKDVDQNMIEMVQCDLCCRWAHFECAQYKKDTWATFTCKKCQ